MKEKKNLYYIYYLVLRRKEKGKIEGLSQTCWGCYLAAKLIPWFPSHHITVPPFSLPSQVAPHLQCLQSQPSGLHRGLRPHPSENLQPRYVVSRLPSLLCARDAADPNHFFFLKRRSFLIQVQAVSTSTMEYLILISKLAKFWMNFESLIKAEAFLSSEEVLCFHRLAWWLQLSVMLRRT